MKVEQAKQIASRAIEQLSDALEILEPMHLTAACGVLQGIGCKGRTLRGLTSPLICHSKIPQSGGDWRHLREAHGHAGDAAHDFPLPWVN